MAEIKIGELSVYRPTFRETTIPRQGSRKVVPFESIFRLTGGTGLVSAPVFVHGFWRSGNTYLFEKFNAYRQYRCYMDPFHEDLDHAQEVLAVESSGSAKAFVSPYATVLGATSHGQLQPDFTALSARDYFETDPASVSISWVRMLVRDAETADKTPVFLFARSLARSSLLQREFPESLHVIVLRNPVQTFLSMWRLEQHGGHSSDLDQLGLILTLHTDRPRFRRCAEVLNAVRLSGDSAADRRGEVQRWRAGLSASENLLLFMTVFLESTAALPVEEGLVLGLDQLGRESYRARLANVLKERLGVDFRFDDARRPVYGLDDLDLNWSQFYRLTAYVNSEHEDVEDIELASELAFLQLHTLNGCGLLQRQCGKIEALLAARQN